MPARKVREFKLGTAGKVVSKDLSRLLKPRAARQSDDSDDVELTDAELATAQPIEEVWPASTLEQFTKRRGRGPQKAPKLTPVNIRLEADVVDAYKATGSGWQKLMREAISKCMPKPRRPRQA